MDDIYRAFEDRFRGSHEMVTKRLAAYLPFVAVLDPPRAGGRALDIGCGRGEWIKLINAAGWTSVGIDNNQSMVDAAKAAGATGVQLVDALDFVRAAPDNSFGLVTSFHVVEHLPIEDFIALLLGIRRILAPGGLLLLETPNPENLTVASWAFRMDPTHVHPIPPALLQFLVETYVGGQAHVVRLNSDAFVPPGNKAVSPLALAFTGSPDYAVAALMPGATDRQREQLASLAVSLSQERPAALSRLLPYLEDVDRLVNAARRIEIKEDEQQFKSAETEGVLAQHHALLTELRRAVDAIEARRGSESPRGSLLRGTWQRLRRVLSRYAPAPVRKLVARLRAALRPANAADVPPPVVKDAVATEPARLEAIFPAIDSTAPYRERLIAGRLLFAARSIRAVRDPSSRTKQRLAYVSPFPPERTGIADYSVQLLPALSAYYEIDVVTYGEPASVPRGARAALTVDAFIHQAANYDRVLYHFGNSQFHWHIAILLRFIPGVVVLHDVFISGLFRWLEHTHGQRHYWLEELAHSHGVPALRLALSPDWMKAAEQYPCNFSLLDSAQGAILHSRYARDLIDSHYPQHVPTQIVPFARMLGEAPASADSDTSQINDEAFVFCSFGNIQPLKQSARLIDCWNRSKLSANPGYQLVLVGNIDDPEYKAELSVLSQASLGQNVFLTGFVSEQTYHWFLKRTDVAVQLRRLSRGETSAAIHDCLASGIATILNAHGSSAEIPDDACFKIADEFEDAELIGVLETMAADAVLRDEKKAGAIRYSQAHHDPHVAAKRYHDAIESFETQSDLPRSNRQMAEYALRLRLDQVPPAEIRQKARELARRTPILAPCRRIFFDVSVVARSDARTGVERVVRSQLLGLLENPPDTWRIEPVRMTHREGAWKYVHGRRYALSLHADCRDLPIHEEVIDFHDGDVLFVADLNPHDIVQAHSAGLFTALREVGVRLYFAVYDILPISLPHRFPPQSQRTHIDWLFAIAEAADGLICISDSVASATKAYLSQHGALKRELRIASCLLGADIGASSPTSGLPTDAARTIAKVSRAQSFLMVGTIEPRKRHLQVLKAFSELWNSGADVVLVIVGAEGWRQVAADDAREQPFIVRSIREHPELGRRLLWLDGASDEYLDCLYASAKCLIAASDDEGFGLPLVEAARHGLPIIARDIPVFREIAGDHALYFAGDEPECIISALEEWMTRRAAGDIPNVAGMKTRTWTENVTCLKSILTAP